MESTKKTSSVLKALKRKVKEMIKEKNISDSDLTTLKADCLSDAEIAQEIDAYLYSLLDHFKTKKKIEKFDRVSRIIEFMVQDTTHLDQSSDTSSETSSEECFDFLGSDHEADLSNTPSSDLQKAKISENTKGNEILTPQTIGKDDAKEAGPQQIDSFAKKDEVGKMEVKKEVKMLDPEKLEIMRAKIKREKERLKELKHKEKKKLKEEKRKVKEAENQKKMELKMLEKAEKKIEKEIMKVKHSSQESPQDGFKTKSTGSPSFEAETGKKEDLKLLDTSSQEKTTLLTRLSELVPLGTCLKTKFSLGDRPNFPEEFDYIFIEKPISEFRQHDLEEIERQICSLLNTKGGRIFFGVNSRRVVIGDTSPLNLFQKLALKIALIVEDGIYPKVPTNQIRVDRIPIQNSESHNLLRIEVQKGDSFKLYCTSKGKYFWRNQGVLAKYSPEQVQDLITENAIKAQDDGVLEKKEEKSENIWNWEDDNMSEKSEKDYWYHPRFKHWEHDRFPGWGPPPYKHKDKHHHPHPYHPFHHGPRRPPPFHPGMFPPPFHPGMFPPPFHPGMMPPFDPRMMPPPPFDPRMFPPPFDPRMMPDPRMFPPPFCFPGPGMFPPHPFFFSQLMMQQMQQAQQFQQQQTQQQQQQNQQLQQPNQQLQQPIQQFQQSMQQLQPFQPFQQPMQQLQQPAQQLQQPTQQLQQPLQQMQQQQPIQQIQQQPIQQFQQLTQQMLQQQQSVPEFYQTGFQQFNSMNRPQFTNGPLQSPSLSEEKRDA